MLPCVHQVSMNDFRVLVKTHHLENKWSLTIERDKSIFNNTIWSLKVFNYPLIIDLYALYSHISLFYIFVKQYFTTPLCTFFDLRPNAGGNIKVGSSRVLRD